MFSQVIRWGIISALYQLRTPGSSNTGPAPLRGHVANKTLFFLIEDRISVHFKYRSFACYFSCLFCFPLGYKPLFGAFSLWWWIDFLGQMRISEVIKPHFPSAFTVVQSQRHRFKKKKKKWFWHHTRGAVVRLVLEVHQFCASILTIQTP